MNDNAVVPINLDGRRKVWLKERETCITATDVAKILGISKYGSAIDVYAEKIGEAIPSEPTEPMRRGLQLEPAILRIYGEEIAPVVPELPYTLVRCPTDHLIAATLDARRVSGSDFLDGRPVDAKNVGWHDASEWGDTDTDQMPKHFGVQLMIQMYVTGTKEADLAVLFSGNDFRRYTIQRVPEVEEQLAQICREFWENHVLTRTPPEVDGSESYAKYLAQVFAKNTDVVLRATSEQDLMASELNAAKEDFERAEEKVEVYKNRFKAAIGTAKAIEGPKWKAAWGLTKDSTGTDWEAVAKAIALEHASKVEGVAATHLIAELVKKNQIVTKKGSRRFTFTYEA